MAVYACILCMHVGCPHEIFVPCHAMGRLLEVLVTLWHVTQQFHHSQRVHLSVPGVSW